MMSKGLGRPGPHVPCRVYPRGVSPPRANKHPPIHWSTKVLVLLMILGLIVVKAMAHA